MTEDELAASYRKHFRVGQWVKVKSTRYVHSTHRGQPGTIIDLCPQYDNATVEMKRTGEVHVFALQNLKALD